MKLSSLSLRLLVLFVLGSLLSCSQIEMLPNKAALPMDYENPVGDELRIMTWNVEHFVDEYDSPYTDAYKENNASVAPEKKALFIEAILKSDADVVVLQEFESAQYLEKLMDELDQDHGYQFFADYESLGWYMNVVIMSKVPLGVMYGYGNVYTPVEYVDEKGKERKETQININTRMWSCRVWPTQRKSVVITGLHLKAGRDNRDIATRTGQIDFLNYQMKQLTKINKRENLVVLGDFNAYPDSKELELLKQGTKRTQLFDPLGDSVYSHPSDQPERRLDYILYNSSMEKSLIDNSAKIYKPFEPGRMRIVSDHLPVIADFEVKSL